MLLMLSAVPVSDDVVLLLCVVRWTAECGRDGVRAAAGAPAGAGAGAGGVNSLSAIFPPGFDAKPWYDIVYPIVDVGSENGFIQFVHSLEMLLVLVGMSDKSVEHVQEILAHW